MAIVLVAHTAIGSSDGIVATTGDIDTSGATFIAVVVSYEPSSTVVITDSKSNGTPTARTAYVFGDGARVRLHYWANPTVGGSHNFTVTGVASYPSICVAAYSGVLLASPYDQENGGASNTNAGSVTPSEDNELLIAGAAFSSTQTVSVGSSFTIQDQIDLAGGLHFGVALADKIQTTLGAENPTWSAVHSTINIATFKATTFVETFPAWKSILAPQSLERRLWAGVTY